MVQLTRIQQAATSWRDVEPQELPPTGAAVYMIEELPGTQRLPFADQVCCVLHWNGYACNIILSGCWAACAMLWIMTHAVLQCLIIEQGRAIDVLLHGGGIFVTAFQMLLCCDLCRWLWRQTSTLFCWERQSM